MQKILRFSDENRFNLFETDKTVNKKGLIYNVLKQRDYFLTSVKRLADSQKVN